MLSIRQRLTLWYTAVLMVMLIAFATVIFFGGAWQLQRSTDQELLQTALLLTPPLQRGEDPLAVDTSYRVLTLDGQVIRNAGLPVRRVPVEPAALAAARQGRTHRATIRAAPLAAAIEERQPGLAAAVRVITVPLGNGPVYILQVGKAETDVIRLRGLLLTTLLIALAVGLPIAALGGWWLAGRVLNPMRAMTAAAQQIEAHDLAERLPVPPHNDELGQLATTFNGLLDRLQAAFQRERRFIADVSHDLRTPLALMKSTIGVALNRPRSAGELQATLGELDGQINRVSSLLEATLFLSRADADRLAQGYAPLDLSELLTDLVETTAPCAAEEHSQELTSDIAPGLYVTGDRDQLTRLFLNLLDNAMRYTPDGGTIRVGGQTSDGRVVVEVADTGAGIAVADLPHVFDRFYRGDKARTGGDRDHHGLGLAIAQAIAHAHRGEIAVRSELGKGSTFMVTLPGVVRSA
ncbi:MAG: ATP-binding protein [Chloroflexi bacterium]|nr:ATP-binding protein [Chloroflexota bacterium]